MSFDLNLYKNISAIPVISKLSLFSSRRLFFIDVVNKCPTTLCHIILIGHMAIDWDDDMDNSVSSSPPLPVAPSHPLFLGSPSTHLFGTNPFSSLSVKNERCDVSSQHHIGCLSVVLVHITPCSSNMMSTEKQKWQLQNYLLKSYNQLRLLLHEFKSVRF